MKKLVTGAARLAALALVPLSMIAQPQKADAILKFYIFEQGNTTKIKTIGSLNLPNSPGSLGTVCSQAGFDLDDTDPDAIVLSTGNGSTSCATKTYQLGNSNLYPFFSGYVASGGDGGVSNSNYVSIFNNEITISSDYVSGDPINNDITFNVTGIFSGASGIASWRIMDGLLNSTDSVEIYLQAPPSAASVPAPLPLAGGALAFGWSRRLRRRAGKAAFSLRG
jgi:hypothetical protein